MKKYIVELSKEERDSLLKIVSDGKQKSNRVINSLILINCDEGEFSQNRLTDENISMILKVSTRKIERIRKKFVEYGFDSAIEKRKSSREYSKKTDGEFEARLIALSCSSPPEGIARWSLRLLAEKVVELEYTDGISHELIRNILKKTN
jgi:hypothetical protein